MKTNIWLKVNGEKCRIKLDQNKFPYVVIGNEKIIIKSSEFPRTASAVYGLYDLHMELISGLEELQTILANPELTTDKLSLRQRMRVG